MCFVKVALAILFHTPLSHEDGSSVPQGSGGFVADVLLVHGGVEMQSVRNIGIRQLVSRCFIHILRPSVGAGDDEIFAMLSDDWDDLLVVRLKP